MRRLALMAVFVVAACGSFGPSQPHTLSLAYKAGDTYKYKFHSTSKQTAGMSGMSIPVQVDASADETVTVRSVDSSGVADLSISLGNFTVKSIAGGVTNTTSGVPTSTIEIKIRPDGTLVSFDGYDAGGTGTALIAFSGVGGGFFISAVLPDHSVKQGDTWTKTYDQPNPGAGTGGVHIASTSTYVRDESTSGVTAAVIETKSKGTIQTPAGPASTGSTAVNTVPAVNGTFTADVTTWIDPSGHRVLKSHSTTHDDLTVSLPSGSSADQGPVRIEGPISAKGDTTTDLTPA